MFYCYRASGDKDCREQEPWPAEVLKTLQKAEAWAYREACNLGSQVCKAAGIEVDELTQWVDAKCNGLFQDYWAGLDLENLLGGYCQLLPGGDWVAVLIYEEE